jgi:hypothetical protein
MTMKYSRCTTAMRRPARFLGKVAIGVCHALRASFVEPHGPSNSDNDAISGRYFGLLVHVGRPDR